MDFVRHMFLMSSSCAPCAPGMHPAPVTPLRAGCLAPAVQLTLQLPLSATQSNPHLQPKAPRAPVALHQRPQSQLRANRNTRRRGLRQHRQGICQATWAGQARRHWQAWQSGSAAIPRLGRACHHAAVAEGGGRHGRRTRTFMALDVTSVRSERRVHQRMMLHMGSTRPCMHTQIHTCTDIHWYLHTCTCSHTYTFKRAGEGAVTEGIMQRLPARQPSLLLVY